METLNHALSIDDKRNKQLEWHVEEIVNTGCTKAEGIKKLAEIEATDEERVYMGYLLVKFIIFRTTPGGLYSLICKICNL